MLNAISFAEKVRTPSFSSPSATVLVADMRPVPRVHLGKENQIKKRVSETKKGSCRRERRRDSPDDGSSEAEVLSPGLGVPSLEESLERDLGLGVETVVSEETVVGRERKDDLGGSSDEVWRANRNATSQRRI